jgi:hypothetical protein
LKEKLAFEKIFGKIVDGSKKFAYFLDGYAATGL